jgi:hypothetical protein
MSLSSRYRANVITTAGVLQELIQLAKDIRAARQRGEESGLSDEEIAFYDALAENESAVQVMRTSIRFPFWEPNRRPKTGFEVVAEKRRASGFTANPSPSSGAGKSGENIVSLVRLSGSCCAR